MSSVKDRAKFWSGCLTVALVLLTLLGSSAGAQRLLGNGKSIRARDLRARLAFTRKTQALQFEPNQDLSGRSGEFVANGLGYSIFLQPEQATLTLRERPGRNSKTALKMKLQGANSASTAIGMDQLPGRANYFLGNDPRNWHSGVPVFASVRYHAVYPGVDLIYHGNEGRLEYDFVLDPGVDPGLIKFATTGARKRRIDRNGDLVFAMKDGEIRFRKPTIYQRTDGADVAVDGRYVLLARNEVGFRLAEYDRNRQLIIDPVVTFATYLGGDRDPAGQPPVTDGLSIATDPNGNMYVTGTTTAVNDGIFPVIRAYQTNPPSTDLTCPQLNAFVAKLDSSGNRVYVTYLGGTHCNLGQAIAADAQGNAVVTGWTESADFPVTAGAFQPTKPNPGVGLASFVTKFDANGGLVYSSYIAAGNPGGVAVDAAGNTYLTGATDSTFSPRTTAGAYQTVCASSDTFILKLSPAGAPLYSSCLASNSGGGAVAVDPTGNIYVLGGAFAGTSLAIKNGSQASIAGHTDAFLAKLFPGGAGTADLLYSTLFGGSEDDQETGLAVNDSGQVWISGNTGSGDLPVTTSAKKSPCVPRFPGVCTAWVAQFDTTLAGAASLVFATYLSGSSGDDDAEGVALDANGNAFVGGFTASADFPTLNSLYPCQGCADFNESAFVTEFSPAGTMLLSTFLGGSAAGSDEVFGIVLDPLGNILLTGESGSENLPPAVPIPSCMNPVQSQSVGGLDAFIMKLSQAPTAQSTTTTAISSANPSVLGETVTFTATVTSAVCTSGIPTGTVSFFDGTTGLGTQPLTSGISTFATSTLSVGTHAITAMFNSSGGATGSTSPALTETVNTAATQTNLTGSPDPASPGQTVTFTATVSPISPGAGSPTGAVSFVDGATALGQTALSGGVASINATTLSVGSHSIVATYNGDPNFSPSMSSPFSEQIALSPPVIAKAFGSASFIQGLSTTLTFTIVNPNATTSLVGVGVVDNLPTGLLVATPNGLTGSCGAGTLSAASASSIVSLSGGAIAAGANCVFSVNVTGNVPGTYLNSTQAITSSNGGFGNQAVASVTIVPATIAINLTDSVKVTDAAQIPSVFVNVQEGITVTDADTALNTLVGNNVVVKPVDSATGAAPVTLTFATVAQPGMTSLVISNAGPPPPSGFQLGNPPVYYNLSTTAVYTPPIQICINYAGVTFQTPPGPRLFHFENGAWVDHTASIDTTNQIVCGSVSSLSPFALFQSAAQADLSVRGFAFPDEATVGHTIFYLFLIDNLGPDSSNNVVFTDTLPMGTAFVGAFSQAGRCSTPGEDRVGTVKCILGSLATNQFAYVVIEVEVTGSNGAIIEDTGAVSAATFDPNLANNAATVSIRIRQSPED